MFLDIDDWLLQSVIEMRGINFTISFDDITKALNTVYT